jgi:hypothetical protein
VCALQAVPVRSLPLSSDAERLQFAFALWADDLAATVPAGGGSRGQQGPGKQPGREAAGKRAAEAAGAAGNEQVDSSGDRPAKMPKA